MPAENKLTTALKSRKLIASAIALGISSALYWAGDIDGQQLASITAIVAAVYTGSVALEDGLTAIIRTWFVTVTDAVGEDADTDKPTTPYGFRQ